MKSILKNRLFIFIISGLIFSSITYCAYAINASEITYGNTTVEDALTDLNNISNPENLITYTNSAYTAARNTTNTVTLSNLNKGHYICTSYYAASSWESSSSRGDTTSVAYTINGCKSSYTYNSHGHWNAAEASIANNIYTSAMTRGANFYCEIENDNSTITINYSPSSAATKCSVSMQISCTKIR